MMPQTDPAATARHLEAIGLSKRYGGHQAVVDVALRVNPGEVVALMGPNGAGKSTIYRILTGAERADTGRILIDGRDVAALPTYARARLGLSYLPQEPSAFAGLSVADNIRLALENHLSDRKSRGPRLRELLEEMELSDLATRKPAQLSGGQRKRCEIARLLAVNPRYVLMDEPFASLDPLVIELVQRQIRQLAARGIGVLITDHNIRATLALADRAVVIVSGTLLADGPPETLLADPALRSIWLGQDFKV
jgi:lipopolysaccharide export system ATP-binding protein